MQECPGRIEIALYKTAQSPASEDAELIRHLKTCAQCQSTLSELEKNSTAFNQNKERIWTGLEQKFDCIDQGGGRISSPSLPPPEHIAKPRFPYTRLIYIAGGLAAAAAVALIIVLSSQSTPTTPAPDSFRYKGSVNFSVFAERSGRQFQVESGAQLMNGDEIRFVVSTEAPGYISVFSVDGRGTVTPFYPDSTAAGDTTPWWISASGRHELPGGVTLDDVLGKEHYVVAYSNEEFERASILELVRQSLREGKPLNDASKLHAPHIRIRTLTVNKIPRQ